MVSVNPRDFWARVIKVNERWEDQRTTAGTDFAGLDALCVLTGKQTEVESLSEQLNIHLLGVTFTDTIIMFTHKKLLILCSGKKLKLLGPLMDAQAKAKASDIEVVLLEKSSGTQEDHFKTLLQSVHKSHSGKRIATLTETVFTGSFANAWEKALDADKALTQMNAENAFLSVLSFQDEREFLTMKDAATLAVRVMKRQFYKKVMSIVDQEEKYKLSAIATDLQKAVQTGYKSIEADMCDSVGTPTVQSGGTGFDLTLGAASPDANLSFELMMCRMGVSYREYKVFVARTYCIDPSKLYTDAYKLLIKVQEQVMTELRPRAPFAKIYANALALVQQEKPELVPYFSKSVGWGIGLPFQNKNMMIEADADRQVGTRQCYAICVGFEGVPLSEEDAAKTPSLKDGKFSISVGDTVYVNIGDNEELTAKVSKSEDRVNFQLRKDDEEEEEEEEKGSKKNKNKKRDVMDVDDGADADVEVLETMTGRRATRSQFKTEEDLERERASKPSDEMTLLKHQDKLMRKKAASALRRGTKGEADEEDPEDIEIIQTYSSSKEFPSDLRRNRVQCDQQKEAVFLPIGGYHVPFHVSTIKSVSRTHDEGKASFLRINFFFPTSSGTFPRDTPIEARRFMSKFPRETYIKNMSFRSLTANNLNSQLKRIKELQKRARLRQRKREEEADLVDQAKLVVNMDARSRPQLDDVSMRPNLSKGKCIGRLSGHINGVRFRSNRGEQVDITYSNIKHLFFQPCKNDLIVLVHFNLKQPIMVGKTKTHDVQFFTEVVEGSTALDGRRRQNFDPDEIDEENRERMLRRRLNNMFKKFCESLAANCEKHNEPLGVDGQADVPYHKLSFKGTPFKNMVTLSPTTHALVNLMEMPFFVVSLQDVEHIHFERVDFRISKNFDMVIIKKSNMEIGSAEVPQRIGAISMLDLDTIKTWIDERGDLTFTFGVSAINWKMVMPGVHEELRRGVFWLNEDEDGEKKDIGWKFLSMQSDEQEEGEDDEESDYAESASESEEEEEEEDSDDDDESDGSSSGGEEGGLDSEDEEGMDWDEMEKVAARSDKKKSYAREDRDEERRGGSSKKKKGRR